MTGPFQKVTGHLGAVCVCIEPFPSAGLGPGNRQDSVILLEWVSTVSCSLIGGVSTDRENDLAPRDHLSSQARYELAGAALRIWREPLGTCPCTLEYGSLPISRSNKKRQRWKTLLRQNLSPEGSRSSNTKLGSQQQ